ncbi:hypothetical protein [Marinibacterium profundimaris]|uniref:hypothetical protein n=1 Tax=Marinibacterium profundimaris TaxID=1679460 RepID=UPI00130323CB|nr:hypothetical protein [Marinibacterium profundimaris]
MADGSDLDPKRRTLLASVLAGGALYAVPMIATLTSATTAHAAGNGGRPETPGAQGQGPDRRPAEPGEGGRGVDTDRNPGNGHDGGPGDGAAGSSSDGGTGDGAGSSEGGGATDGGATSSDGGSGSGDPVAGTGPFRPSDIGRGFA